MKISSQEEYGLRCLLQIARVSGRGAGAGEERWERGPVPISEIAVREGLSVEYVGKILMKLRKAGLVESTRGKAGGYLLSLSPSSISLRRVLDALSDPMYEPDYCRRFRGTEEACVHQADCGIRSVWVMVNRFLAETLERVSLADLVRGEAGAAARLLESMREQVDRMAREDPEALASSS